MKQFLILCITILLLILLIVCGYYIDDITVVNNGIIADYYDDFHEQELTIAYSRVIDELVFSSIDDFLSGYMMVKNGRATGELAAMAESVDLMALERFHLPIGIPETYQLYQIVINELAVSIRFLPEEYLDSELATLNAIANQRDFHFAFYRWDLDRPMDGVLRQNRATEECLINERYLFVEPNMFLWGDDRTVFLLYTPLLQTRNEIARGESEITGMMVNDTVRMVGLAETATINLLDTAMVSAFIDGSFAAE